MKHLYHTTLICLVLSTTALAQTFKPTSHWRAGSTGSDGIWDIAIDTAGNQYICGYFTGTVDMDPGPGVYNLTQPSGQTQPDAFLLKLDANGNFLWAKSFGGTVDGLREIRGVELDNNGNVYLFGRYSYNIQFEPNGTLWATNSTNAINANGAFVAKLSQSGSLQWGIGWFAPSTSNYYIYDLQIDQTGDIYIAGMFQGVMDFNPYSGSSNVISRTSSGIWDMALLKLAGTGIVEKVRVNGSAGHDGFSGIALSENNTLFVGGTFSNTIDMNWGSGVNNISSSSNVDLFIMKLDTALNFKWVKPFGGLGIEYVRDLKRTDAKLAVFGVFHQNVDLDPSPSNSVLHTSNGDRDCFIQLLDTNGNYTWSRSFGGTGLDDGWRMHIDNFGHYSLSGQFSNTVDFDPSISSDYFITSAGGLDGYVLDLDNNGNFLNAAGYGSSTAPGVWEFMTGKASNSVINGATVGYFRGIIDINPNQTATQNVTSAGQDDMLYLTLEACTNATIQYTDSVCDTKYVLPNGTTVFQGGYYLNVLQSSQGCDSTVGVTVVLNPLPDTTITQTGATFSAQPGLSYQWYNCQSGQPIAGETNQTFTATANGQYAVIVSNGTCADTSSCITLDNIGLPEAHLPVVNVYPNPTNGVLHIATTAKIQRVEVADLTGRLLLAQPGQSEALNLAQLPTGIYLVKVYVADGVAVRRVVKQ